MTKGFRFKRCINDIGDMMDKKHYLAVYALFALMTTTTAKAATVPISYLSDDRSHTYAEYYGDGSVYHSDSSPTTAFSDWGAMTFGIDSLHAAGTGGVMKVDGGYYTSENVTVTETFFDITFQLYDTASLSLNGTLQGPLPFPANASDYAWSEFALNDVTHSMNLLGESAFAGDDKILDLQLVLNPGVYQLYAAARGSYNFQTLDPAASYDSRFTLDATFASVPIPTAALLLLSGLSGLFGFVGRRKSEEDVSSSQQT